MKIKQVYVDNMQWILCDCHVDIRSPAISHVITSQYSTYNQSALDLN